MACISAICYSGSFAAPDAATAFAAIAAMTTVAAIATLAVIAIATATYC